MTARRPPWYGTEDADFMPALRRQFADLLPSRLERARGALQRLRERAPDHRHDAGVVHSVAHDLRGTAATLGAEGLGDIATRIAAATLPWLTEEKPPATEHLESLAAYWAELESRAEEFHGWLEWEARA